MQEGSYSFNYYSVFAGPYLRKFDWGGGGGGGRHKIMPYSDNGLLKVVIIFQHLSMAANIFSSNLGRATVPPAPPLNTALLCVYSNKAFFFLCALIGE